MQASFADRHDPVPEISGAFHDNEIDSVSSTRDTDLELVPGLQAIVRLDQQGREFPQVGLQVLERLWRMTFGLELETPAGSLFRDVDDHAIAATEEPQDLGLMNMPSILEDLSPAANEILWHRIGYELHLSPGVATKDGQLDSVPGSYPGKGLALFKKRLETEPDTVDRNDGVFRQQPGFLGRTAREDFADVKTTLAGELYVGSSKAQIAPLLGIRQPIVVDLSLRSLTGYKESYPAEAEHEPDERSTPDEAWRAETDRHLESRKGQGKWIAIQRLLCVQASSKQMNPSPSRVTQIVPAVQL